MDNNLIQLINNTPFLSQGDKSFLLEKLSSMSPLDKLKLQQSLIHGQAPSILQSLQLMRAKFFQSEQQPKAPDLLTKIANKIIPPKPKIPISVSILNQPQILGLQPPVPAQNTDVKPLQKIVDFYHPFQLGMLNVSHVTFGLNDNSEQMMQSFFKKADQIFEKIESIQLKRSYFMNFLQSQLFGAYIQTGLTALRHPELEPAKIILNLLYQINPTYLNNQQFKNASIISNHLRELVSI